MVCNDINRKEHIMKRELKIGFRKPEPEAPKRDLETFEKKTKIVVKALEGTSKKLVLGVLAYVTADTVRKVIVNGLKP